MQLADAINRIAEINAEISQNDAEIQINLTGKI